MLTVVSATLMLASGCGGDEQPIVFDTDTSSTTSTSPTSDPSTAPPVVGPWVDVTANLSEMPSECGNVAYLAGRPTNDQIIAGIAGQGMWVNSASGDEWIRLGGDGPARVTNRASTIVFDPEEPGRYWESGSYGAPGAVRTDDGGRSFVALGDLAHIDGMSVDLTDPQRRTLLAGGHERTDLYRSTDGGATWENIGPNLPPDIGWSFQPLVINSQVHLLGTIALGEANSGIFRTTDGGASWEQVGPTGVQGPPLRASDGTIYWMLQNNAGLARSTDDGATWQTVTEPGMLTSYNLVELPDGELVTLGASTLAISADGGLSWRGLGPELPNSAYGLAFSEARKAIYTWMWDCNSVVPTGAIQRLDISSVLG